MGTIFLVLSTVLKFSIFVLNCILLVIFLLKVSEKWSSSLRRLAKSSCNLAIFCSKAADSLRKSSLFVLVFSCFAKLLMSRSRKSLEIRLSSSTKLSVFLERSCRSFFKRLITASSSEIGELCGNCSIRRRTSSKIKSF